MYKVLKRTCSATVLPITSFVFPCPRYRRRRGLLKVPVVYSTDTDRKSPSVVLGILKVVRFKTKHSVA